MYLLETYRGTVRREELDEMGHMNVAYYLKKSSDGLDNLRNALGLKNTTFQEQGLAMLPVTDRILFKREVHHGDALSIRSGIRAVAEDGTIDVVNVLTNEENGELAAQFETFLGLTDIKTGKHVLWPDDVLEKAKKLVGTFDDYPMPEKATGFEPSKQQFEAMPVTHEGQFIDLETDASGLSCPAAHIARFWDAAPKIFGRLGIDHAEMVGNGIGSAALEYILTYHKGVPAGTAVQIRSCMLDLGEKVFRFGHYMADANSGEPITSVEVVAVLFDLNKRKAVRFPDEYRENCDKLFPQK